MRLASRQLPLWATLLVACAPPAPPVAVPLVDGLHAPLILTESALLEMPPAYSGNRFLRGWWPDRRRGALWQANAADRVVVEGVFLDGRERRLATQLAILEATPGATFSARVAGVALPPQPLVPNAEIPLPGGLPLGRLPIEIDLRGARVTVGAAGFGHAWPAGEVEVTETAILQGGYSAVDFPRRLNRDATLVGRFEPPGESEPDQRFALLVETDAGGSQVAFEWLAGEDDGGRTERLQLPLPAGFVRIRLLAQGFGAAGRWLDLGIAGDDPEAAADEVALTTAAGRDGTVHVAASARYRLVRSPGLGLAEVLDSRDAEYLFDLEKDPSASRNIAGAGRIEADWLRARLTAWIEAGATAASPDQPLPAAGAAAGQGPPG